MSRALVDKLTDKLTEVETKTLVNRGSAGRARFHGFRF